MLIDDWTPVTVQLPDDCTLVLLAMDDEDVWPGFRDGDIWRSSDAMPIANSRVTDWMHFPPAPKRRAAA